MVVRIEKTVCTVLDEAHKRQVEETNLDRLGHIYKA
jgi:hypothetical protein